MNYLIRSTLQAKILISFVFIIAIICQPFSSQAQDRPNILWLTSEDNSPFIGAYGDEFASTPNIDRLAESGFLYTHAYANAPVCAPARNTIITGMYPPSNGNQHMRSNYRVTEDVQFFPELLRQAGYYVTNNSKTDYNIEISQTDAIWDESSAQAHYNNRQQGQPFFAVFNTTISHESSVFRVKPPEELNHNPEQVTLPPYHPDTQTLREQWALYYDRIQEMDNWVGERLAELEASGEADNTIVFYYGDHGGVLPRSKRYVYESGTHVPLIISIPEKYKEMWPLSVVGSEVDRMVSFVDLAPTILSLVGIQVPDIMQGQAFLGDQVTDEPEYVHMFRDRMDERYDMSRATRDAHFRYIRNYKPYRIYGQHVDYLFLATGMQSWEQTCRQGDCDKIQSAFWNVKPVEELYDVTNDPWEVNNLAEDPAYTETLKRMRSANRQWMVNIKDTGVIPEFGMQRIADGSSLYDRIRKEGVDVEAWINIADQAITADINDLEEFTYLLSDEDFVKRYWAAVALRVLGEDASESKNDLKKAIEKEEAPFVHSMMAEALYVMGDEEMARNAFAKLLKHEDSKVREFVLNAIDSIGDNSDQLKQAMILMSKRTGGLQWVNQDHRIVMHLFEKWGVDPEEEGLEFDLGWIESITDR